MARGLILDTNTLIAYERATFDTATFDDDDLAIAAITVAEFRVGIELCRTALRLPSITSFDPLSDPLG